MSVIFNSLDLAYKTPFGAVPSGEKIIFTLRVPINYGCQTPFLFIKKDGQDPQQIQLNKTGQENNTDIFQLVYTAGEVGLYFYYFDLWVDYRKLFRGANGKAYENTNSGNWYQLTVYDPSFKTPENTHGAVMYQIFPDRFFEGNPQKPKTYLERIYRTNKAGEPYFWNTDQENGYLSRDYFGGDLVGIEQKLPYLKSLGVNWIYLNPVFEAHSNHRYNTADYMNIDPYLGTNEDFTHLCQKAKEMGIKIIIDGVFNHTGSDSIYFNKEARYPDVGAWQSPESVYRPWFYFHADGKTYDSWWGFDTLPTCNKENLNFREFICGENGVIDTWIARGASGFRLDVVDELPDDFVVEIRNAVKNHGEDKYLIGEVWEDASTKEAYGKRREYFWGHELDGVMNYPFRTAIINFLKDPNTTHIFRETVESICENYPAPALASITNHLGTHDTMRIITALVGEDPQGNGRAWQSGRKLSPDAYARGIRLLEQAFVLQFTLPGIPCVYYGDEIAMQGYADPFNRAYFNWNSPEKHLIPLMKKLSALRASCPAFASGTLKFIIADNGLLVYQRTSEDGNSTAIIAINAGNNTTVDLFGETIELSTFEYAWRTKENNVIKNI